MSDLELAGRVAVITGGTRGIGRAIAESFLREGAHLFLTYAGDEDAAQETRRRLGLAEDAVAKVDVRDRDQLRTLFSSIEAKHGRIDVLVNNAGINKPSDFDKITDVDWDEILSVNLKGPFIVTQEALHLLRKSDAGSIIQIGSVSGQYGGPRTAHYAASKAGLISLSQVVARFLAGENIRSNTIAAGLIESEMATGALSNPSVQAAAQNVLLRRFGRPAEVAEVAVFLASNRSSYITGQTINANGGLYF